MKIMRSKYLHPQNMIVAFDVETTGLSVERGDRVVEIAGVKLMHGRRIGYFNSLVSTGRRISRAAGKIHGIIPEMLEGMPGPDVVFPSFFDFIGRALLVAHNARFDIAFLRHEFRRLGFGLSNPHECTLRMSRRICPELPDHSLSTVYRRLCGEIPLGIQPHRALYDACLTAEIWLRMTGRHEACSHEKGVRKI